MKKIQNLMKQMIQDESGQGATEYILLLVVIVGLSLAFRKSIMQAVNDKLSDLSGSLGGFKVESGG